MSPSVGRIVQGKEKSKGPAKPQEGFGEETEHLHGLEGLKRIGKGCLRPLTTLVSPRAELRLQL
jgi:hypothetical protein